MGNLPLPVEMAEKREHRRLQKIERGRVGHRSAKAPQYSFEDDLGGHWLDRQVEDRFGDAMSKRRVMVDELTKLPVFEKRTMTGHCHSMGNGAGAFQCREVVGQREEIRDAVFVKDVLRQHDVSAKEDVADD